MKRKITVIAIFLFIISISFNLPVLASTGPVLEYSKIWTVGSNGSADPKTVFYWNETPWLYLELPVEGLNFTGSWWEDPESNFYFADNGVSEAIEIWISLESWGVDKKPGDWNIDAFTSYASGSVVVGQASFTVVPEPASTILFLSGVGTLVVTRFWRSRKR
jgi:hypothetical protein